MTNDKEESWICTKCGTENESAAGTCLQCGEKKEVWLSLNEEEREWIRNRAPGEFYRKSPEDASGPREKIISDPQTPVERALDRILLNQYAHSNRLKNIEGKVGCMFAWMMFGLAIFALRLLLALLLGG